MKRDEVLARFDRLLAAFDGLERKDRARRTQVQPGRLGPREVVYESGFSGYDAPAALGWFTRAEAALLSVFRGDSPFVVRFVGVREDARTRYEDVHYAEYASKLRQVFQSARDEIADGYVVERLTDQAKAETELDLVHMARRLLDEGDPWRAAAAVTAGGAVELHLKYLCERHGIEWSGHGSIGAYTTAIRRARPDPEAYPAADDSQVDRWRTMRNDAAHDPTTFALSAAELRAAFDLIEGFIRRTAGV